MPQEAQFVGSDEFSGSFKTHTIFWHNQMRWHCQVEEQLEAARCVCPLLQNSHTTKYKRTQYRIDLEVFDMFFFTCKTHWVYILCYCMCADYKWNTSPMDVLTFVSSSHSFIGWPATPSWRRAPWERRSNEGEEGSRWPLLVLFRWASIYASQWPPLSQSEREYVWNTDFLKNKT